MTIHIGIIEDSSALRKAIREWLVTERRFEVSSECGTAEDALEQLPQKELDVVLVDINLPRMNGIECVRLLKTRMPRTQFVMLTVYDDADRIFEALAAGATGYLLKRASRSELLSAVDEVHKGGSPMSSSIARKIVQSFQRAPGESPQEKLSPREKQVLDLLTKGLLYKEIAAQLQLSVPTVNCYIRAIYEKLQVHSRSQAVAKYLRV